MDFQALDRLASQFVKLALRKDPFRNMEHDIEEAIDFASNIGLSLKDGRSIIDIPPSWLSIQQIENFPLKNVLDFDDYSAWGDMEPGQLRSMSRQERTKELRKLRGAHAAQWLDDGIPAIILLDICGFHAIGDGRGRTNFAVGMGFNTVPVVLVSIKSEYQDQINLGAVE